MRYIVYGAGSIGGVIAARLFEQGFDVVLIARGDHLSAIQRSGLTIESPLGSVTLPVRAVEHPSEIDFQLSADIVLLATKTQDSAQALNDLRRAAGPEIPVLCLQNGVESERIALRHFDRVAGAMTIFPSSHLQPGVVQSFSAPVPGVVDLGRFPAGEDSFVGGVVVDLRRAGFHSELRPDILRWQYGKLLENLKNALQALCGPDADYNDLLVELRMEAESCYRAAGIAYASKSELRNRARGALKPGRINGVDRLGDSSWQSLARAKGSIETDFLNGEIALLGRLHGIPTPLNARLQDLANRFARERRPPASLSVDDVHQLLRGVPFTKAGKQNLSENRKSDTGPVSMSEENKREYSVPFKGRRPINKRQANVVGFTLICGFLAAALAVPTLGKTILSGSFVLGVTVVSYILGKKLFG